VTRDTRSLQGQGPERLWSSITLRDYLNERTFAGMISPDWGRPRPKTAGVAPYRAASWPRDRAPPGRKPRVSAHSGYGRSAGAADRSAPHSPSVQDTRTRLPHLQPSSSSVRLSVRLKRRSSALWPAARQRRRAQRPPRVAIGHRRLVLDGREHGRTLDHPDGLKIHTAIAMT
jgi:hypothetical protein